MSTDRSILKKIPVYIVVATMVTSIFVGWIALAPQEVQVGDQSIETGIAGNAAAASKTPLANASTTNTSDHTNTGGSGPMSVVVGDSDTIVVKTERGRIEGYSKDGTHLWTNQDTVLVADQDSSMSNSQFHMSVSADGSTVYTISSDYTDWNLVAIDVATGSTKWTRSWSYTGDNFNAFEGLAPAVSDGSVYIINHVYGGSTTESYALELDASDGSTLNNVSFPSGYAFPEAWGGWAVDSNGNLFAPATDGSVNALVKVDFGAGSSSLFYEPSQTTGTADDTVFMTAPAFGPDGNIYWGHSPSLVTKLDSSGSVLWQKDLTNFGGSGEQDELSVAPFVDANGNVGIHAEDAYATSARFTTFDSAGNHINTLTRGYDIWFNSDMNGIVGDDGVAWLPRVVDDGTIGAMGIDLTSGTYSENISYDPAEGLTGSFQDYVIRTAMTSEGDLVMALSVDGGTTSQPTWRRYETATATKPYVGYNDQPPSYLSMVSAGQTAPSTTSALYFNPDTLITNYLAGSAPNEFTGYSRSAKTGDENINKTLILDPNGAASEVTVHQLNPNVTNGRMLEVSIDGTTAHEFTINTTNATTRNISYVQAYRNGELYEVFGLSPAYRDSGQVYTIPINVSGYTVIALNSQPTQEGVCSGVRVTVDASGNMLEVGDSQALAQCLDGSQNLDGFQIGTGVGSITYNMTTNVTDVTVINETVIDETTITVENVTNVTYENITNVTTNVSIEEIPEGGIGHRVYFDETVRVTNDTGSTENVTKTASVVVSEPIQDITDVSVYNATIADDTTNGIVVGANGEVNITKQVDVIGNTTITKEDYQTVSTAFANVSDVEIVSTSNVSPEKIAIVGDVAYPSLNVSRYEQYFNHTTINQTTIDVQNVTNVTSFGWRNCNATFQRPGEENEKSRFWINQTRVTLTPDEIIVTNTSGEEEAVKETYPWPTGGSIDIAVSGATVTANETAVSADSCVYSPGTDGATLPGEGNWEGFADVLFKGVPARVKTLGFIDAHLASTSGHEALSGISVSPQFGTAVTNVTYLDRGAADDFGKRVAKLTVNDTEGQTTVTIRNLDKHREYQVFRNGEEWQTKETGDDGKLSFTDHRWSTNTYTVLTGKSVAPAEEPVDGEDGEQGVKIGGGVEAPPTMVIIGIALLMLLLAGAYIYREDKKDRGQQASFKK